MPVSWSARHQATQAAWPRHAACALRPRWMLSSRLPNSGGVSWSSLWGTAMAADRGRNGIKVPRRLSCHFPFLDPVSDTVAAERGVRLFVIVKLLGKCPARQVPQLDVAMLTTFSVWATIARSMWICQKEGPSWATSLSGSLTNLYAELCPAQGPRLTGRQWGWAER